MRPYSTRAQRSRQFYEVGPPLSAQPFPSPLSLRSLSLQEPNNDLSSSQHTQPQKGRPVICPCRGAITHRECCSGLAPVAERERLLAQRSASHLHKSFHTKCRFTLIRQEQDRSAPRAPYNGHNATTPQPRGEMLADSASQRKNKLRKRRAILPLNSH